MVSSFRPIGESCSSLPRAGGAERGRVEHEVGDLEHFGTHLAALAADQGAQARFQFLDRKRLGEVVIGAGAQAGELLVERVAGGEHQHRRRLAGFLAQALAHFQAVQAREHEVEDDHVVTVLCREAITVEPVGGIVDFESPAFEVFADHFRNVAVVFDDEDEASGFFTAAHGGAPGWSSGS